GSNVSGNQYTNASMEWDFYGGFNGKINDDLGYTAGLIYVVYPGGKTSLTPPNEKWDTAEINAGLSWKWLSAKVSYSLTNFYGIGKNGFVPVKFDDPAVSAADNAASPDDSDGSIYTELNFNYELPMKVNLLAHVGHQKINNYKELDYTDWKLGAAKEFYRFNFMLAYTDTNAKDFTLFHLSNGTEDKKLADGKVALTVTKTF
ncbi:MAG: TorF family putative porin, partial [Burkholderiales bacterium]